MPRSRPPYKDEPLDPVVAEPETLENVKSCVELFDTDAAADEVLCGKMLSNGVGGGDMAAYLPNMKIRNKDKAHGSRRTVASTCDGVQASDR